MSDRPDRRKVLFLPGWYPSRERPFAGIFVEEHAKAARLYDDVVVVYLQPASRAISGLFDVTRESENGIDVLRVSYRRPALPKVGFFVWLYALWAVTRRLGRRGFRPDVIHAHIYHAGPAAILLGALLRVPVVISEHSSAFARGLLSPTQKRVARMAMSRARWVLPVSEALRASLESCGIRGRFRVLPNAVATELFHPDLEPKREPGAGDVKRLLTVSLLTPIKGIDHLLGALARLRRRRDDFVLDVVGDGPDRRGYEALAAELGLGSQVVFHGLKSKREVAGFMHRCDVFVFPSLFETFGVSAVEALACGKPVVASDVGGLREIIEESVGRLVPAADPPALARALDEMLDRYRDFDTRKIADYARARFSHEVVGRMLHDVYEDVAAQ